MKKFQEIDYHLERFARGVHKLKRNRFCVFIALAYLAATVYMSIKAIDQPYATVDQTLLLSLVFALFLIYVAGGPLNRFIEPLSNAGITDSDGNVPKLLSKNYDAATGMVTCIFYSKGIPLDKWKDKVNELQSALNITVVRIELGADQRHILVTGVKGSAKVPEYIEWNDNLVIKDDSRIRLGKSLLGDVIIDLNSIPMWLVGGATGSGKSVLVRLIARQCIFKHMKTFIVDFKGGMDYMSFYHREATFVSELQDLASILDDIVNELHRRKELLGRSYYSNITTYNNFNPVERLERIVIVFDEVAEVLDKTGLSKEDKQFIQENIEAKMSTIARLGRAVGIHLILSLQRPDSNILNGQLRSNITGRIAGRCDINLSEIIFDNGHPAEKIDSSEQGLFLINDTNETMFRGYYTN